MNPQNFSGLVRDLIDLISLVIPLIFSLTLVVISWQVIVAWVINGGDATTVEEGNKTALVGVLVLVVMSGIWGILAILRSSIFGV